MGAEEPAGAGRFARSLPTGEWRQLIVRQVAQDWAARDALGAEKWAARLPEAGERNLAQTNVCLQVVQTDARLALEMAERNELLPDPGRSGKISCNNGRNEAPPKLPPGSISNRPESNAAS